MGKKKGRVLTWKMDLNPETYMRFQSITVESMDLTIRRLLKDLSKAQDIIDEYEIRFRQCSHNSKMVVDDLLDKCAENATDYFAAHEIEFLKEIKLIIFEAVIGKPTKAVLMDALKKINNLIDKEKDEIENVTGIAEKENPENGQASGKE